MPKAKKTPSGKYNCKVVDHYEHVDGKRIIKFRSITAATKTECERLAAVFQEEKESLRSTDITIAQAVDRFIASRDQVVSPNTLKGYKSLQQNAFSMIADKKIYSLRSEDLQIWINDYSRTHSPKSCRNAYALLTASVALVRSSVRFRVTLPQKRPPRLYTPTDNDIRRLLEYISGTALERAVLLSACGTLRRSEACALTYDDFNGCVVRVEKSLYHEKKSGWFVKYTKTPDSVRYVEYPPAVIERVLSGSRRGDRVVGLLPDTVTNQFREALIACGLPLFRFHDLRAYAVSFRHALGIPDVYIMQDGGYKSDAVMKSVYRRAMDDKRREFSAVVNGHFAELLPKKK